MTFDGADPFASADIFDQAAKVVNVPTKLNIFQQPTLQVKEGQKFTVQPWIELLDENGARVISSDFSISVRLVLSQSENVLDESPFCVMIRTMGLTSLDVSGKCN